MTDLHSAAADVLDRADVLPQVRRYLLGIDPHGDGEHALLLLGMAADIDWLIVAVQEMARVSPDIQPTEDADKNVSILRKVSRLAEYMDANPHLISALPHELQVRLVELHCANMFAADCNPCPHRYAKHDYSQTVDDAACGMECKPRVWRIEGASNMRYAPELRRAVADAKREGRK